MIPNGLEPAATSDGRTLVFVSPERKLWRANGDGRNGAEIFPGFSVWPLITADDQHVVFLVAGDEVLSPWIIPIGGGAPSQVVKSFVGIGQIDVSPTTNSVVFVTPAPGDRLVTVVCNLPNCTARRELSTALSNPRWTPDGNGIAYLPPPKTNIWVHLLNGSKPRQLTHFTDERPIVDFRWSRDGKRLAIARQSVTNDIVLFRGLKK